MKPDDKEPAWKNTDALDRVFLCQSFLLMHGFLTQEESDRVHERMMKWVANTPTKNLKQPKAKGT